MYPENIEQALADEGAGTPSLADFARVYEQDGNVWWRLSCGHHQNLLDEALDLLDSYGWSR